MKTEYQATGVVAQESNKKLIQDLRLIIEQGRRQAYVSVNQTIIQTYWNIGRRIVEEEQGGKVRAEYGKRLIANLAEELSPLYGSDTVSATWSITVNFISASRI